MDLSFLNKLDLTTILVFVCGTLLPLFIGLILPRRKTVGYGRLVYKLLGTLLLQKRLHNIPASVLGSIINMLRATFVDFSFGIYIESRTDLSVEDKTSKIEEYISITLKNETTPETPVDTLNNQPPTNE